MDISISNFLASFPYAITTKRTYRKLLSELVNKPDIHLLSSAGLLLLIDKKEWGSSRQCVALSAFQKYLAWAYGQQHPALSARLKRVQSKPQRSLTQAQAGELLASFNPYKAKGSRDLALCALALDTGLRASELCRLQQADTDRVKNVLQVIVKGGQWSAAIFSPQTSAHIESYMSHRKVKDGTGFMFTNIFTGDGLTVEGLNGIINEWGRRINIKLSPHDLRRSFATLATENGAPERVLMAGGRWSSSQMVNNYTRTLKLEAMRKYLPMSELEKEL